jgi:hypothetical protein
VLIHSNLRGSPVGAYEVALIDLPLVAQLGYYAAAFLKPV